MIPEPDLQSIGNAALLCAVACKAQDWLGALMFAEYVYKFRYKLPAKLEAQANREYWQVIKEVRTKYADIPLPTDNTLLQSLVVAHGIYQEFNRNYRRAE